MLEQTILNGRYELIERVGSGGMAAVYQAKDRSLGRIVAVKLLHESFTSDEGFLRRFQQEAHAAANLTHPNVVTVHDIGQDGHRHYIVMEFVEGQTVKQLIKSFNDQAQFMPLNYALDLIIGVCDGIGYAHRAGLVHCDVKPHNVIVTPDQRVKVADFGIARAVSDATQHEKMSQVWGTPQYFAPEQASGEAMTPATDVYAIGVMLFEMLTGRLPFTAESHTAMALKHLQEKPPLVSEFNPAVPHQIALVINKVLAKEPTGRYRTAGQLGRILNTYRLHSFAETGSQAAPIKVEPPDSQPLPVAEQTTQIYEHPLATVSTPKKRTSADQTTQHDLFIPYDKPEVIDETAVPATQQLNAGQQDWTAITLGIAAIVALLGLIPLWLLVFLAWNP